MFSIIIKGERNLQDIELVKLTMVFYKTGYPRVPKVLYITGAYADWQKDKQCFVPNSAENISKNSLLQKEKMKYLKIAEKWEYSGKNWIPIELAHCFDKKNGVLDKYTSVSEIIKQIEKETADKQESATEGNLTTDATQEHFNICTIAWNALHCQNIERHF